jgi:hypothetical protein
LPDAVAASFQTAVRDNTLQPLRSRTSIEWRSVDEECYRKGAAALVLEQLYRVPDSAAPVTPVAITA